VCLLFFAAVHLAVVSYWFFFLSLQQVFYKAGAVVVCVSFSDNLIAGLVFFAVVSVWQTVLGKL
jgi:hypothetical protein